ncbi:putative iron-sulfur cluster assembly accessory protein Isa1 [Sphaerosporella brunnea]|uniref:Iron-sulfur assembly protein 1 n=1 Tax=Sphaerosporella brunnea TaxID=1250544 RepID=A0A5J5FB69_9PEZI|nr:putative iron-sulfur cluster assembly accessory protein Isa1 [Sphaerosporella brunnea]
MPSLRCLAPPVTSLRSLLVPATNAYGPTLLRASYSSSTIGSSKRLLQTQTYSSPTLHTEPPFSSGSGVESSLTNPSRESFTPGPPPPPPSPQAATNSAPTRTKFRPRKSAMRLTPAAVSQLKNLMDDPEPKLIRIGVKNRGCSGLAYHLEYVDKPGRFDEEVVQDGVRVLIDSKALFSIIGSEMDWVEDKLSARFVFKNPNIKEQCGCGESFSIA